VRVIDSSSLVKFVNKEQNWEGVLRELKVDSFVTVELAIHEVANSIWKRVLKREVSQEVALKVFQEFVKEVVENGLVTLVPISTELLSSALRLASEEKITVYDSEFIELARPNKWDLVTSDERQYSVLKRAEPKRARAVSKSLLVR
jgi:predicted nucleic acid-binding protein